MSQYFCVWASVLTNRWRIHFKLIRFQITVWLGGRKLSVGGLIRTVGRRVGISDNLIGSPTSNRSEKRTYFQAKSIGIQQSLRHSTVIFLQRCQSSPGTSKTSSNTTLHSSICRSIWIKLMWVLNVLRNYCHRITWKIFQNRILLQDVANIAYEKTQLSHPLSM